MRFIGLSFLVVLMSLATEGQWIKQSVNTSSAFRGLSVVNENVVWASGTGGTVIRTTDAGKAWKVMTVPGAEKLDFRDIEAFDANTAYVLSIGNGEASRIYKTIDGGVTWKLKFTNTDEKAFYDALACWSRSFCLAMSDPVDGRFRILSTVDAGETWKLESRFEGPHARVGEAAFAASGTCIIATPDAKGFFIVSGGSSARVSHASRRTDGGLAWRTYDTPIIKGTAGSGIFSIAMLDASHGVIVGGDYEKPNETKDNLAFTTDGGRTWSPAPGLTGFRSAAAYLDKRSIIAVGTNGTDLTTDGGGTWKKIGDENLNAVAAKGRKAVWAVGPKGMVAKLK
jgi:photosystem II stability/assembly factor-like uncharacterized protein